VFAHGQRDGGSSCAAEQPAGGDGIFGPGSGEGDLDDRGVGRFQQGRQGV